MPPPAVRGSDVTPPSTCSGGVCPSHDLTPPSPAESRARAPSSTSDSHLSTAPSPQLSPSPLRPRCQQRQLRPLPAPGVTATAAQRALALQPWAPLAERAPSPTLPPTRDVLGAWAPEPGGKAARGGCTSLLSPPNTTGGLGVHAGSGLAGSEACAAASGPDKSPPGVGPLSSLRSRRLCAPHRPGVARQFCRTSSPAARGNTPHNEGPARVSLRAPSAAPAVERWVAD